MSMSGWGPAGTDPVFEPQWLNPNDVKEWLRINDQDSDDDDLILRVTSMAEPYAERCRPEFRRNPGGFVPDAETYQGAVMYAAREYRRRNSPAGIETMGGDVVSFVSRFDPDIDRALQTGAWARPVVS